MIAGSEPHPLTGQPVGLPVAITSPAPRPDPVTLKGRFGSLARLDAARHAAGLWRALRERDDVWTYMSFGPFADETAFGAWLAAREKLKDPYAYTVLDQDDRELGLVALMSIKPDMRVIEVGSIVYSPALQRTPLATEAQYLLARHVFETLGYRRYEWKCDVLNARSRRAAARYGFVFEAIFRQHMIVKARNRDTAYFSIVDSEWPARKAAFERWLQAENFDHQGRQKISLAVLNDAKRTRQIVVTSRSEPHPQTGHPVGPPVDPKPAPRPGPVTLKGRYGRLEKLGIRHTADLWTAYAGHDRVWTYISTAGPFASAAEFASHVAMRAAGDDPYAYAIVDTADRAIGYVTLLRIVPQMRVVEVGHVLYSPTLQRTPLGTETQYLLARYVFETLGYRRYEWKCNTFNAPSWRAALRYGFVYEGIFRQYMIGKGRNRDDAWFSMLDSEWPARKRNFERWLDPDNFDDEGRQRVSLAALNGAESARTQ